MSSVWGIIIIPFPNVCVQVQYFISPYGASALVNLLRGSGPQALGGPAGALTVAPGARMDAVVGAAVGAPPASGCQKKSLYSSLGKLGKVRLIGHWTGVY